MSETLADIKMMASYSDELTEMLRDANQGKFKDVPNGDLQGIAEALVRKIYLAGKTAQ